VSAALHDPELGLTWCRPRHVRNLTFCQCQKPIATAARPSKRACHGTLDVEIYKPVGVDQQTPHARDEIYVVPNPATPESMRAWTLEPNNIDPTGVKVEFHHLPQSTGRVAIYTLAGDLIKELTFDGTNGNGSVPWDLVSRNGQDVTSGVYLFAVDADDASFKRFVGKFVVIR